MKELNLNNIDDCRFYLENLKLETYDGTRSVVQYQTLDGERLKVIDMDDEQLIQYANQMYNDLDLPAQRAKMT